MRTGFRFHLSQIFKTWSLRPLPMMAVLTLFVFMVNLASFSSPVIQNWQWVRLEEFLATLPSVFLSLIFGLLMLWFAERLTKRFENFRTSIYWLSGISLGLLMALARALTVTDQTPPVWQYPNALVRISVATFALYLIVHVSLGVSSLNLAKQAEVAETARKSLAVQRGKLISAQEDVRRQLADFLHDRLQSDLVLLGIQLQRFIEQLNDHDKSVAQAYIDEIERIRQFEVRGVSKQLAPEFAGPYFTPALQDLASRYGKAMQIELSIEEQGKLPELLRLACFRIIEQALLNAAKHAASTQVQVEVEEKDHELLIRVVNDGQPLKSNPVAGAGFATIDEWVGQYSGTWSLGSIDQKTHLSVSLSF